MMKLCTSKHIENNFFLMRVEMGAGQRTSGIWGFIFPFKGRKGKCCAKKKKRIKWDGKCMNKVIFYLYLSQQYGHVPLTPGLLTNPPLNYRHSKTEQSLYKSLFCYCQSGCGWWQKILSTSKLTKSTCFVCCVFYFKLQKSWTEVCFIQFRCNRVGNIIFYVRRDWVQ